jgi:hypothetical protein
MASTSLTTPTRLTRSGVDSSLAPFENLQPATPVLQVRAHLATHTGSPGGSKLVASSSATCNWCVAGSVDRPGLRENRCFARGIEDQCNPMRTCVGSTRNKRPKSLRLAAQHLEAVALNHRRISTRHSTTPAGENSREMTVCRCGSPLAARMKGSSQR